MKNEVNQAEREFKSAAMKYGELLIKETLISKVLDILNNKQGFTNEELFRMVWNKAKDDPDFFKFTLRMEVTKDNYSNPCIEHSINISWRPQDFENVKEYDLPCIYSSSESISEIIQKIHQYDEIRTKEIEAGKEKLQSSKA